MLLRPYQADGYQAILAAWDFGALNVVAVFPTGAGKTVLFSEVIRTHKGNSCAIAHRQELVGQISVALARDGVRHRIIGPNSVIKRIVRLHMAKVGRSFYDPSASTAVAGVDTLVQRNGTGFDGDMYYHVMDDHIVMYGPRAAGIWPRVGVVDAVPAGALHGPKPPRNISQGLGAWLNSITLWVQDECHHLLADNKWGTAVKMFPNAKGLGVTATLERADGQGLGAHVDGVFHTVVEGPGMRDLINAKYLTEYKIFAPPNDLDLTQVKTSKATGDFNPQETKKAVRESCIIGDVVQHYLRIAPGKLGVTFATDVETATDIAAKFNAAGVPAEVVSAKTPDAEREAVLGRFERRELLQLVNVDLFGEGFDLPAIEVVSMARPTQSYGLYVQQFGRALRLLDGKRFAIIIDHVGNVDRHGLPDAPRTWSLDRREKRSKSAASDKIPMQECKACTYSYQKITNICPDCGYTAVPAGRSSPELVDGDLIELDAATLAKMRGEIEKATVSIEQFRVDMLGRSVPAIGQAGEVRRHLARQVALEALKGVLRWWGGYQRSLGRSDSESYRRFYFRYGMDMMTAQALKTGPALALTEQINEELQKWNVI